MLLDAAPKPAASRDRSRARLVWAGALTFTAYVLMTWVGLSLPVAEGVVSPVWAPAGIAVVGLVVGGLRLWPVVVAAAFVGNLISGSSVPLSAGISFGNGAEALFAAWVLLRVGFSPTLTRARDIAWLVPVAVVSCAIAATNGVTQLWLLGYVESMDYVERWLLWWSGDAMGILVVGPFLFAVLQLGRHDLRHQAARVTEFVLVHGLLAAMAVFVFSDESTRFPALMFPFLAWSTMRFRQIGSATSAILVAAVAISSIIYGTFLFDGMNATQSVQTIQVLVAIVVLSTLMVSASLTESEQLRDQLARSLRSEQEVARHLRLVDETKDRLLAAVSHELRTPLTSILALSSLLQDGRGTIDDAKLDEMYGLLTKEATRLDSLLTDLLDLERLRLGMFEPDYAPVDLPQLVRSVLERHAMNGRDVRLDLEPLEIRADATKVERIVDNIVGNAIKHTPADSAISIAVREHEDGALLVVDDCGTGVPLDERNAIFEPFTRGAATLPATVPGTGIGLSLVAHFALLHGGRAWVEDRVGGGASFRVYLPTAPAATPPTPHSFQNGTDVVAAPIPR